MENEMTDSQINVSISDLLRNAEVSSSAGNYDQAIAYIQQILVQKLSHDDALKLLREIRQQTAVGQDKDGKVPSIHLCLAYDDSLADLRILTAIGQFVDVMGGKIALYGMGRLTSYLLRHLPHISRSLKWIIEDDPQKQTKDIAGIKVVPFTAIPKEVNAVFLSSTRSLTLEYMNARLDSLGQNTKKYTLSFIGKLDSGAIPTRAWSNAQTQGGIYQGHIPNIEFEKNKAFLLLELPPRQIPMLPYGVGYVHNALERAGIDIQTFDFNIVLFHRHNRALVDKSRDPGHFPEKPGDAWNNFAFEQWTKSETLDYFADDIEELIQAIAIAKPRILGISLHHPTRQLAEKIVAEVRLRHPEVVVMIGGYDCVSEHTAKSKFTDYDYIVVGEAELTLPPLVKQVLRGDRPRDLPGIISKDDTPDRSWIPGPASHDLDSLGYPKYDWFDLSVYQQVTGATAIPYAISRGCAWGRCNFCGERFHHRTRSVESIVGEFQWFYDQGYTDFSSMESDVNGDPALLLEICNEIIRRKMQINLFAQVRVDKRCDYDFFVTLKKAGFYLLVFGVDGWNNHTLKLQRKGYNMRIVERNLRDCSKAGIATNVNMVAGVPGETEQDIEECIANIIRLKDNISVFSTINMLRLVPGSPYYHEPDRFKIQFRGNTEEIFSRNPNIIPESLWYSEDPYIDHEVRMARYSKICRELMNADVPLGAFAKMDNAREIARIKGEKQASSFEKSLEK